MDGVTIVNHPLVQHKLTLLRKRNISTKSFRELLKEIGMLLCYEVTRDLPLADVDIETPLAAMKSPQIAGKKLVFAPVLRAGVTFAEGMLDLVPSARIAHIGLYREPETFVAVEYFFKAPSDLHERLVIVISPVLATANSAVAAVDRLKERGANDIGRSDLARSDRQRAGRERLHPAWSRRRRRPRLWHQIGWRLSSSKLKQSPALVALLRCDGGAIRGGACT
jgi:uracil phosphoribosyltransferase